MIHPESDSFCPRNGAMALSHLTCSEVEHEVARFPALLVPLGGCEPWARCGALGVASACAEAVAETLSSRNRILLAPTLPYGCSTSYGAFEGSSGLKPRTFENLLCETIRLWRGQGFRLFIIVDGLFDNFAAVEGAVRRLRKDTPKASIEYFSLQRNERIRAFMNTRFPGKEPGRAESGMLSLAAFIDPTLVRAHDSLSGAHGKSRQAPPDGETFRRWKKRGGDPQQFRKLFPAASTCEQPGRYDADFGRELFGFILRLIEESIAPFLAELDPAAGAGRSC